MTDKSDGYFFKMIKVLTILLGLMTVSLAFAAGTDLDVGKVATTIQGSMSGLAKLITSGSLVAGMAFAVGAILKFKQHKDNPTQIPVGTPIALIFIAAALLFLPTIFNVLGQTMFGGTTGKANLSGDNDWTKS